MPQWLDYVQALSIPGVSGLLLVLAFQVATHYIGKIRDERLRALLYELVKAAEQIYGAGNGPAKLRYVEEQATRRGLGGVTRDAIEASVWDLRTGNPAG